MRHDIEVCVFNFRLGVLVFIPSYDEHFLFLFSFSLEGDFSFSFCNEINTA